MNGDLDATGGIVGPSSNVVLAGIVAGRHVKGLISGNSVTFTGPYTQNGTLTIAAGTTISSGGSLTLNGNVATMNGAFTTSGTGTITMTNGGDVLSLDATSIFSGGNETGLITAGTINVTRHLPARTSTAPRSSRAERTP